VLQHECLCVRSHQHAKLTIKPSIRSFDVNIASIPSPASIVCIANTVTHVPSSCEN